MLDLSIFPMTVRMTNFKMIERLLYVRCLHLSLGIPRNKITELMEKAKKDLEQKARTLVPVRRKS